MILNGRGCLTGGLHGYSLVSGLFLPDQSNIAGCFCINIFALIYICSYIYIYIGPCVYRALNNGDQSYTAFISGFTFVVCYYDRQ